MQKKKLSLIVLTLTSLMTFSQGISKTTSDSVSVRCLTNEQMKVINGVFLDYDYCQQENIALNKIINTQDTMLKSKIELEQLYKQQALYNENLQYQLTASINTQIQRFNALESTFKSQNKQQKRKGIAIGSGLGIGFSLTLALLIFQISK